MKTFPLEELEVEVVVRVLRKGSPVGYMSYFGDCKDGSTFPEPRMTGYKVEEEEDCIEFIKKLRKYMLSKIKDNRKKKTVSVGSGKKKPKSAHSCRSWDYREGYTSQDLEKYARVAFRALRFFKKKIKELELSDTVVK